MSSSRLAGQVTKPGRDVRSSRAGDSLPGSDDEPVALERLWPLSSACRCLSQARFAPAITPEFVRVVAAMIKEQTAAAAENHRLRPDKGFLS